MSILIVGYYNKKNAGDDLYEASFAKILTGDLSLTYCNIDNLEAHLAVDYKSIIFGGGDLINVYFIAPFVKWWKRYIKQRRFRPTLFAVSIGIPFPSLVDQGYLDIFDSIFVRSKSDMLTLKQRYQDNTVFYTPDIVFSLSLPKIRKVPNRNVGVFLSRNIYNKKDNFSYKNLLMTFELFLTKVHCMGYSIVLISMNSDCSSDSDNDMLLNKELERRMQMNCVPVSSIVMNGKNTQSCLQLFYNITFSICMKYHAHILSVMTGTPFISVYSTRKVKKLIEDLDYTSYAYQLPIKCSEQKCAGSCQSCRELCGHPVSCDGAKLSSIFTAVRRDKTLIESKFEKYMEQQKQELALSSSVLLEKIAQTDYRISSPSYIDNDQLRAEIEETTTFIDNLLKNEKDDPAMKIMHHIFGRPNECLWGLRETISSGRVNAKDISIFLVKFKYEKVKPNTITSDSLKLFKFDFIRQEVFSGYHRAGWKFVMDGLQEAFGSKDGSVIFDGYVDKTFLWGKEEIVYNKPWIGFVHHTDLESDEKASLMKKEYTKFTMKNMVQSDRFRKSVPFCKGLFVLAKKNEQDLLARLHEEKLVVEVNTLTHPTFFPELVFSPENFDANKDKKLLWIGGWLRDPYFMYSLLSPIRKVIVKGKDMDNYFKPHGWDYESMYVQSTVNTPNNGCGHVENNKFIQSLIEHLRSNEQSVDIINFVNNDEYDRLLSENIVCLKLVDAAAVNTLIECIVRNTPILVNPLPAVVEYLGEDYPFYYHDDYDAFLKLANPQYAVDAYVYLKNMDKSRFHINTFLKAMSESSIFKSLN